MRARIESLVWWMKWWKCSLCLISVQKLLTPSRVGASIIFPCAGFSFLFAPSVDWWWWPPVALGPETSDGRGRLVIASEGLLWMLLLLKVWLLESWDLTRLLFQVGDFVKLSTVSVFWCVRGGFDGFMERLEIEDNEGGLQCDCIGNVPSFLLHSNICQLHWKFPKVIKLLKFVNNLSNSHSSRQVRRSGRRDRFERSQLACNVFVHLRIGQEWVDYNLFDRSYQPGLGSWGSVSLWSVLTESYSVLASSRPNIQNWRDL